MTGVERILVSACLLGAKVRYHGGDAASASETLRRWVDEGRVVAVCPEVDGGLTTPRPPAEIAGPDGGRGVIARAAFVRTAAGADVTPQFLRGATAAIEAARRHDVRVAILKDGSPSCGSSAIYDGTFSGTRIRAEGVTAAALQAAGVRVFSETEIDAAARWLRDRESRS
jgi:uncharacterized protein YbbK (DUF523 family)